MLQRRLLMLNANSVVLIMAGGTGGHVIPALSVAKELQKLGVTIHWLDTQNGIEADLVPAAGIELHCLSITGLRGKGVKGLITARSEHTSELQSRPHLVCRL